MDDASGVLYRLYGDKEWPSPFHALEGLRLIRQEGMDPAAAARRARTTGQRLLGLASSPDPVAEILGVAAADVSDENRTAATRGLAQILLGRAAELAFEDIYRTEMGTQEFELVDLREGRTDTDYRLLNGRKRPLYRINIKFTGSTFRRAAELVGLAPEDCFPLATYKIFSATKKQIEEHLPYIFLAVFVRTLNVDAIGSHLPRPYIEFLARLRRSSKGGLPRRQIEDRAVDRMVADHSLAFELTYEPIRRSPWYVLSARKADKLLRELLFDRVYALKIRGFAQQFRGAELDMHFSLRDDLVPLERFLEDLREGGPTLVASKMERGTV
jgi:hypothetical protein